MVDGTETIGKIAEAISSALQGYQIVIRKAEAFVGTDLLPAHIFFLGCGSPKPESFAYLGEMMQHINLAGRVCGIFSSNKKAIDYLSGVIKASDAAVGKPLLVKNGLIDPVKIQKWVNAIL